MSARVRNGLLSLATLTLAAGLGAGCGLRGWEDLAEEAVDSEEIGQTESALTAVGTEGADGTLTPEQLAATVGGRARVRLADPNCVTSNAVGTTVTHTFTDCTGPHGLVHVTGTLVTTFTGTPGNIAFAVTGTGIRVNQATIDVNSTGTLTVVGTVRTLTVNTKGSGVGRRGFDLERDGHYVATYNSATECATLDGTWSLDIGLRDRSTTITGLSRCAGKCPGAGGVITHKGFGGRQVTVSFDGGNTAHWQGSGGRSGNVTLSCTP